jgi:hypothetical protein
MVAAIQIIGAFLSVFTVALASPIPSPGNILDVFVPPIILPDDHTVWKVNSTQTVSWYVSPDPLKPSIMELNNCPRRNATNPPANISNGAEVVLQNKKENIYSAFCHLSSMQRKI